MSRKPATPDPRQDELALSTVLSHALFPGRSTLHVFEVAAALGYTRDHILDLLEEGEMHGINGAGANNKTRRAAWRVPVSAYDEFVRTRWNNRQPEARQP